MLSTYDLTGNNTITYTFHVVYVVRQLIEFACIIRRLQVYIITYHGALYPFRNTLY